MGKGPKNGARSPVNSATFMIFDANYGNRHVSRVGIGVFLSSIGCTAFIFEHLAELVERFALNAVGRKMGPPPVLAATSLTCQNGVLVSPFF